MYKRQSHIRVCRFGDNMNNVAVTEGDKVEAQIKFGWEIDHYNVNDLVEYVDAVPAGDISALTDEYYSKYQILTEGRDAAEFRKHVEVQAAIEIGLEKFLTEHDYHAVVTHFGMLGGCLLYTSGSSFLIVLRYSVGVQSMYFLNILL